MSARARSLTRPAGRVLRPMADLSPGKAEERIRNYPPPKSDHHKVVAGAHADAFGLVVDMYLACFGIVPKGTSKAVQG
jgi:hypothetical protein